MTRAASRLRSQLSASVASAAGPYGYTISLGGSTAMASGRLGSPHLVEALLLMLGAVTAFVVLEAAAQGSLTPRPARDDEPMSIWGNAHVPSAGLALCGVWALVHLIDGRIAWLLVGFTATSVYFVLAAVQHVSLERMVRGRGRAGR